MKLFFDCRKITGNYKRDYTWKQWVMQDALWND